MIRNPPAIVVSAHGTALRAVYLPALIPAPKGELGDGIRIVAGDHAREVVVATAIDERTVAERVVLVIDAGELPCRMRTVRKRTACDPFLSTLLATLRSGFRLGLSPPAAYLDGLAEPIGQHLCAYYANRGREARGLAPARLERALEHIDANLGESCSLDELAALVHLSPFHFCRMFRRSTGRSPHAYLTERRMQRAKELLDGSDMPIARIARLVGFRTQSHFTNAFRQANGTAPGAYRARGRLASINAREID